MDRLQAAGMVGVFLGVALLAAYAPANASGGFVAPLPDFVDHAQAAGLTWSCTHWSKALGLAPRWFIDTMHCASPVIADFNGDGYPDVYFSGERYDYSALNNASDPQDGLFLNNGDGTFTDATSFVGIHDAGYSYGAAALDYDNDGNLDLYVAAYPEAPVGFNGLNGPATVVYHNNGDGTFTRMDPAAMGLRTNNVFGAPDRQFGMAVAVGDYNRDGCVDIFRGNYAQYNMKQGMPASLQLTTPDVNKLYEGHCDGTFTDVSLGSGVGLRTGRTFAASFADLNHDGWPDLTVATDETPKQLYLNNRDGTFTDISASSGAGDTRGSMCIEAQDWNNDGNVDLYTSNYEDELNGYYLGHGDGTFTSADTLGDLGRTKDFLGWACPALDVDNDGALDLFVANGHMVPTGGEFFHPGDPWDNNGYELPNFLFRNTLRDTGVHSFTDISQQAGPGLRDVKVSSGAQAADFDLTGAQSLVVVNDNGEPVSYYKNEARGLGHWLEVELRGAQSNRFGIGAQVQVTAGDLVQHQQMLTGDTLASGSVQPLHFGLGAWSGPVQVHVLWPSGQVQDVQVPVDMPVRIVEGRGVQLDTLAPRVDVQVQGQQGAHGWWTSPSLTVGLSAQDRGIGAVSGLRSLRYRVDDGPVTDYAAPFTVTGEGRHRLTTYATDAAGNSAWYARWLDIDSVAPASSLLTPEPGKVYAQDRAVGDSPTGETLIVAPVHTPGEDAAQVDLLVAGTLQDLKDREGLGSPVPPPSVAGALSATVGSDGRTYARVAASDATSGVDTVTWRVDGGSALTVTGPGPYVCGLDLRGLTLGRHTLTATVTDVAGLRSSAQLHVLVVPTTQDGALNTVMLGPSLGGS